MLDKSVKQCLGLFAVIVAVSRCQLTSASTDSCWINDAACLVHATLHKNVNNKLDAVGDTLPLDVDCATTAQNDTITHSVTQPPDYLLRRFERAFGLTLNGCHKGLKWSTFGFEFLPNCDKILEVTVEQFHADGLHLLRCPGATFIQLEILRFEHNEIAAITAAALSNLSLLRELYFVSNALRHIEKDSFDNLHFIERIHMESEPLLAIKDGLLFERTNVADLRLIWLKHVTSSLFENLPETLLNLTIAKTPIGGGVGGDAATTTTTTTTTTMKTTAAVDERDVGVLYINNPRLLRNVTIIDCDLRVFKLNDVHGSVLFLNLSGNRLTELVLSTNETNTTTELQLLDLSNNQLSHLPAQLLGPPHMLQRLEKLYLQGNYLKQLPLLLLLRSLPAIGFIDLTANKLEYFSESNAQFESATLYQIRIRIDDNPWNCKWLLKFAHANPDKFRVFQYEKFLSHINVNGLTCVPVNAVYENATAAVDASNRFHNFSINGNDTFLNVTKYTLFYGSPWDIKRNQRAEALIIVFMLPVGIAILFLLLYLWIYCQKVFHLSFYQKCPLLKRRRRKTRNIAAANRFDVVRQLPPNTSAVTINNNEGYELPLNGVATVCNCVNANSTNTPNEKCQKMHHITYVPLPEEQINEIYEEIIDEDTAVDAADSTQKAHPIYDHLSFE